MGLSALTKAVEVWDARVKRYDVSSGQTIITDMLWGEKLGVLAFNAMIGPYKAPMIIFNGINKTHIYVKGKCPEDYGFTSAKEKRLDEYFCD